MGGKMAKVRRGKAGFKGKIRAKKKMESEGSLGARDKMNAPEGEGRIIFWYQ